MPVEGKLKLCCVWICKLLVDWAASGTSEGKGDLDFILSQGQGVELTNATADCICIFVCVYLYLYIWVKSAQCQVRGVADLPKISGTTKYTNTQIYKYTNTEKYKYNHL